MSTQATGDAVVLHRHNHCILVSVCNSTCVTATEGKLSVEKNAIAVLCNLDSVK